MPLELSRATETDVDRIAEIHLAAFNDNILLHAQFPTPASLADLQSFLSQETLRSLQDPTKAVWVVRDSESKQVISFAKWDLPATSTGLFHDVTWPEGSCQKYLDGYFEQAEAAKKRVVGSSPCYRLSFIATHPKFQGRGTGTMLSKWGLDQSKRDNIPVYLESTVPASSLYRKLGFVALDGISMTLPGIGVDNGPHVYEELCMLRKWDEEGMDRWDSSMSISSLLLDYEAGIKPQHVVQAVYDRIDAYKDVQPSLWIYIQPIADVMKAANLLYSRWPDPLNRPPLWGIPFSVKDNINIAGIPTTTGCPALIFTPTDSAPVYQYCIDAGGIFIGKTNMEQLATGMTGCRSPYGTLHSTFSKSHIVGGSSSGSAVSVSEGLVSFSIGSDTAGSIRVPAAFNNIVGFKPTKGTVSARGVQPASLHQDCISFLALNTEDAEVIWSVCERYDKGDLFAKPASFRRPRNQVPRSLNKTPSFRFGVPPASALEACSPIYRTQFKAAVSAIKSAGGQLIDVDWAPFAAASELLYNGTFVLERITCLPDGWFDVNKEKLHPVIRQVFEDALARNSSAVDLFRDLHRQAKYKRAVEDILTFDDRFGELTVMVHPTVPFHPTIEEVSRDPFQINTKLGTFAHFANVLDLVGISIPGGTYEVDEGKTRLPFGVTILAGCGLDEELLKLVKGLEEVLHDLGQDD